MSLTYFQMQALCQEINLQVKGAVCSGVSEVGSRTFAIGLDDQKKKHSLLFCLQAPFLRFHFIEKIKETRGSPFVQKLSSLLIGKQFVNAELLNEDRILSLWWQQGHRSWQLVVEFFPRHPNLYVLDEQKKIHLALFPSEKATYQLPLNLHLHNKIDRKEDLILSSSAVAEHYKKLEASQAFLQLKQESLARAARLLKSARRRLLERKGILEECSQWQQIYHEGILLQSNLFRLRKGMDEVVLADWELEGRERTIPLDPLLEPSELVAHRFHRSKKLKLGVGHAERQLQKAADEVSLRERQQEIIARLESLEELESYVAANHLLPAQKEVTSEKKGPPKPYQIFVSHSGLEIWVGKNAKANDKLTFHYAKGSDWWLHARDYAGSHVVIRVPKNKEPDGEAIKDAAELAIRFSKAKEHGGEVSLSQVKWLRRLPSSVGGKVMLSKHKVLQCALDEKRWQRLKQSKNGNQ